jgi:hypothetical protein
MTAIHVGKELEFGPIENALIASKILPSSTTVIWSD